MVKAVWRTVWIAVWLTVSVLGATPQAELPGEPPLTWADEESENNEVGSKQVIGMAEKVYVRPGNLLLDARIDTGANTTSIGADEIEIINEDGQRWALYKVDGIPVRSKVVKVVRIKQHGSESQRRAVVMVNVTLGNVTQSIMATLSDRKNFKYKMLIGVNFLKDHFVVDVSRKYTTEPEVQP